MSAHTPPLSHKERSGRHHRMIGFPCRPATHQNGSFQPGNAHRSGAAPIRGIKPLAHILMECEPRPGAGRGGQPVFNRVVMDGIQMAVEVVPAAGSGVPNTGAARYRVHLFGSWKRSPFRGGRPVVWRVKRPAAVSGGHGVRSERGGAGG